MGIFLTPTISREGTGMRKFVKGQRVKVPCTINRGAFPDEKLVIIDAPTGPISGFVSSDDVEETNRGSGFIFGTVQSISDEFLTVLVHGSFFTTTGLTDFPRDWADSNLSQAA